MQIRSRVNSLRTLCKKGQVASDAHRGSVPNPPPLPRSIGTASFSRPPKAISPEVGSSDSRGQDPNSPTNSSRYFGKSTACKGGARVSANRNCRSRLHQALVSVLPPAPIVKSEASCRVDVLAVWPVPSIEICGHLACFGPVCSSAQCRAPRSMPSATRGQYSPEYHGPDVLLSSPHSGASGLSPESSSISSRYDDCQLSLPCMSAVLEFEEVAGTGSLPGVRGHQRAREWGARPPLKVKLKTAHSEPE
ncbi:hypothetical protein H671_6g15582 [Cricetulus griseus]|nr:hypothetical protein H671_6g15582 [Cricetulus griseus]